MSSSDYTNKIPSRRQGAGDPTAGQPGSNPSSSTRSGKTPASSTWSGSARDERDERHDRPRPRRSRVRVRAVVVVAATLFVAASTGGGVVLVRDHGLPFADSTRPKPAVTPAPSATAQVTVTPAATPTTTPITPTPQPSLQPVSVGLDRAYVGKLVHSTQPPLAVMYVRVVDPNPVQTGKTVDITVLDPGTDNPLSLWSATYGSANESPDAHGCTKVSDTDYKCTDVGPSGEVIIVKVAQDSPTQVYLPQVLTPAPAYTYKATCTLGGAGPTTDCTVG